MLHIDKLPAQTIPEPTVPEPLAQHSAPSWQQLTTGAFANTEALLDIWGVCQILYLMMMWLTPLKPSAVRLLGRPPPLGVRDFLQGKLRLLPDGTRGSALKDIISEISEIYDHYQFLIANGRGKYGTASSRNTAIPPYVPRPRRIK
ncbi:hypothetical protein HaLaN_11251 [Haematococcus lacustris]|uniref:Uncharacterized protein n=1 Tax=Haematococcus lacustris TaxID=44745 RepID=A0A699YXS7_HAELA|nr:hypothetical protein HaLaN_11251 [Haematococcus lacustris]